MATAAIWARTAISALVLSLPLPGGGVATSRPLPRELVAVVAAAGLRPGYALAVTPVPAPPPELERTLVPVDAGCPVEVRAIVIGDEAESGFAILGVEEESTLVTVGEGVRTARGWFAVTRMTASELVLRRGAESFICALHGSATAAALGRQSPAR